MRTIYRKCCRKVLATGLCVSLIAVQSVAQYTEIVEASNEDFSDIFIGMDSVINQLLDFGLDIQEVETLLNVTPKDTTFYSESSIESPYDGTFQIMNATYPEITQMYAVSKYDGNPAKTVNEQQKRFTNVYNVAVKNYQTFRYEGPKNSNEDWGKYFFYLYLSHYMDGPFRAPTANDLPEVISLQDVQAYERFLSGTSMANAGRKMSEFAMTLYSVPDAKNAILNNTHSLDSTIAEQVNKAYSVFTTMDGGVTTAKNIKTYAISFIIEKFKSDFDTAESEEQFRLMTEEYVLNKLNEITEMNDYAESSKKIVITTLLSAFLPIAAGTFTVIGLYVSAIPAYTYIFTTLFQVLNFMNLTQTFNSRYIRRAEIEYGF